LIFYIPFCLAVYVFSRSNIFIQQEFLSFTSTSFSSCNHILYLCISTDLRQMSHQNEGDRGKRKPSHYLSRLLNTNTFFFPYNHKKTSMYMYTYECSFDVVIQRFLCSLHKHLKMWTFRPKKCVKYVHWWNSKRLVWCKLIKLKKKSSN
jgi:hypothetical protein